MPAPRPRHLALAALLALYAVALAAYFVPVVTGADDNGYHVAARMLERHGRFYQQSAGDLEFVGRMWVSPDSERYYSKYPPFYPLLAAAGMLLAGDLGGLLLGPLLAWSCPLAVYLLCRRRRLPADAALLGALVMATLPLFNSFAIGQVSHSASLALLLWSQVAFFGAETTGPDRRRIGLLVVAGGLLGSAIAVRYTNALLILPGVVWFLTTRPRRHRDLAWWSLGWLVPCALLGLYHWNAFGAPWTTAYSLTQEQGAFALGYLIGNLRIYAAEAPVGLVGPVTVLALLGWLACLERARREAWYHLAWALPLLLTVLAYYWAPENSPRSFLRLLLPLVIPAIVLAVGSIERGARLAGAAARQRLVALVAIALLQGAWGVAGSLEQMERLYSYNRWVETRIEAIHSNVEPGSIVIADLDVLEALDYSKRYTLFWTNLFHREALRTILERSLDDAPDSLQTDRARTIERQLLDVDTPTYRERVIALLSEPLGEGRAVYLAGSESTLARFRALPQSPFALRPVVEIPASPSEHRLFAPGESVSRAGTPQARTHAAYSIWQVSTASRSGG